MAIRSIVLAAAFAAAASAADFASLSIAEKQALASELAAWEASPAGQSALANGFDYSGLTAESGESVLDAKLARLHDAKQRIADLQAANPQATFGLTQFALMSRDEFSKFVARGYKGGKEVQGVFRKTTTKKPTPKPTTTSPTPSGGKDWTTSGCVAPVQDQGQCGSCWAFATVASVESAHCMATGTLTLYSEQEVTSCATSAGDGCNGGDETQGLQWVQSNGGLCLESDYTYTSGTTQQTGTCKTTCKKQPLTIKNVVSPASGQDNLVATLNGQPTTVAVTAGNDAWQMYTGGIITSCGDVNAQLDHAVFAVGYGSNFFKIKNSWGTSWGEAGFIRIQRTSGNGVGLCQLASQPAYAVM